jgi:hypothetical protein
VEQQTNLLGRALTREERCTIHYDLILERGFPMTLGDAPGVTVCVNPFASKSFPSDLFNGAFDEHWTITDGQMVRIFAGKHRLAHDPTVDGDSD